MTASAAGLGRVRRVNGPLVEVDQLPAVAMAEVVELGEALLPGEVVAVEGPVATVQAYEYTGGLRPGDPVVARGQPLSAALGPGLLGGVFDGLLRPLTAAPLWLAAGQQADGPTVRRWQFAPTVRPGQAVQSGAVIGTVSAAAGARAGGIEHRVLVPPEVSGVVGFVAEAGEYGETELVATVADSGITLTTPWPVRRPRPYAERQENSAPLVCGQRVIDAMFPLARGSAAAVPGGFGTGKTVLLQQIAEWCDADVIVYVGCGERGNEMADVVDDLSSLHDPRTGGRLADRTVIIANTSNMPMMAREASIYTGVTVAEYFRDMGYDAVVIADSTSRWAEALREFSSRAGALPAEEGFPADLASALAAFYERAGTVTTLGGASGSVTILGAISPPGGDLTEPVTAHTQRFVRAVWTLDTDLAYARHYPAVSWPGSFSRDVDVVAGWYAAAGDGDWARRRAELTALLAEADRLSALAELVGVGALPGHERITLLAGRLIREALLQQSALSHNDNYCTPEKSAAIATMVLEVVTRCRGLVEAGTPANAIEELDFGPVIRARDEVGPADADAVMAHLGVMQARFEDRFGDPTRGRASRPGLAAQS